MLFYEIKKVWAKPINKVALILLAVLLGIGSFLTIQDINYIDESGNEISGIRAAHSLKKEKNKWSGSLTEEVLRKALNEYKAINTQIDTAFDKNTMTEKEWWQKREAAYRKKQGLSDIETMINLAFSDFADYDHFQIDQVKEEEVGNIYKQRILGLQSWLEKEENNGKFSSEEKEYIMQQYEALVTPFYYSYADGWKALLDSQYLLTLIMIMVLIIGFLVSGIFSSEFSYKADAVFFSTRFGRGKGITAKIGAGFLITTGIYWSVIVMFTLIVLGVLGFEGSQCMVQTGLSNWKSLYNITYFQDFWLTVCGGYVGCLFIIMLAMLISAKSHSTVFAVTVPFVLTFIPSFLGRIAIFEKIMHLFPDQLLHLNKSLEEFRLYELGGKIWNWFSLLIPMYIVLALMLLPILYLVYRKTQIH